jgi:hypothetical protein
MVIKGDVSRSSLLTSRSFMGYHRPTISPLRLTVPSKSIYRNRHPYARQTSQHIIMNEYIPSTHHIPIVFISLLTKDYTIRPLYPQATANDYTRAHRLKTSYRGKEANKEIQPLRQRKRKLSFKLKRRPNHQSSNVREAINPQAM